MFNRILCAMDGSIRSERALTLAGTLAAEAGTVLDVVHVVEYGGVGRAAGALIAPGEPEICAHIEQQTDALAARGVPCHTHLPQAFQGHAARQIAALARQLDADLIVVGTRGRAALGGAILGSVTQRLLHEAPCPVLALPPVRDTAPAQFAPTAAVAG